MNAHEDGAEEEIQIEDIFNNQGNLHFEEKNDEN